MSRIPLLAATLLLAGCATTVPVQEGAPPPPPPPVHGMEQVMGKPAETAIALLGAPSLDRREGMARQLQFAGACVLDIFYYQKAGQPPLAIHTEARLPNGRDVAAGDCMRSLMKAHTLVKPPG